MNRGTSSPVTPALEEELCHGKRERFLRHYFFNYPVMSVACHHPKFLTCLVKLAVHFVLLLSVILLFGADIVDIFVNCTELLSIHS